LGDIEVWQFGREDEVSLACVELCDIEEDNGVKGENGDDEDCGEDQKGNEAEGNPLEATLGLEWEWTLPALRIHEVGYQSNDSRPDS
jgi:hypothetical protein